MTLDGIKIAPIHEVVCEFRVTADSEWDISIPGQLFGKIQSKYPRKEGRTVEQLEIQKQESGIRHQLRKSEGLALLSREGGKLVQISTRLFSIHHLNLYPGWKLFFPEVKFVFEKICKINENIQGFERIGLRYINHFDALYSENIAEYFEFRPKLENIPHNCQTFNMVCDLEVVENRELCRAIFSKTQNPDGKNTFILDLDYYNKNDIIIDVDDALSWVDEAHTNVKNIFNACVKDSLKEKLEGE